MILTADMLKFLSCLLSNSMALFSKTNGIFVAHLYGILDIVTSAGSSPDYTC